MKTTALWISMLAAALFALSLGGCRPPSTTDVTSSSEYHFSAFAGTVWKTKVELVLTEEKEYTGAHHLYLAVRRDMMPTNYRDMPMYDSPVVGRVPKGARIRIDRLRLDNHEGLLWVTASLDDRAYPKRIVYLDPELLAQNRFMNHGFHHLTKEVFLKETRSRAWGVNPKYLERDGPPRKAKRGGK